MRLTADELEVIHEALAAFHYECVQALEDEDVGPRTALWAEQTMESCDEISDKIEIVIETIRNLDDRDVACDISLTPGSAKL
jgi:hypothetical protein